MARIDYLLLVGAKFINANQDEYTVLSYEGKDKKGVHWYKIKFTSTGNEYLNHRQQITKGKSRDLLHEKLLKSKIKQQKLKERARLTKTQQKEYKKFNFTGAAVLSLDLSTNSTGYALLTEKGIKKFGVIQIDNDNYRIRNYETVKAIKELIKLYKPSVCFIEGTFISMNSDVLSKLSELRGAVLALLHSQEIEYEVIQPNSWKHYHFPALYSREEQKEASIQYVKNLTGQEVIDDIADAICMGIYAVKNLREEEAV